jgi:hypothetical protein
MDLLRVIGDQLYSQFLYNKKITHIQSRDEIFGTSFTLNGYFAMHPLKNIAHFTTISDEGTQYKDYRVHLVVFYCDTCISGEQPDVESHQLKGVSLGYSIDYMEEMAKQKFSAWL